MTRSKSLYGLQRYRQKQQRSLFWLMMWEWYGYTESVVLASSHHGLLGSRDTLETGIGSKSHLQRPTSRLLPVFSFSSSKVPQCPQRMLENKCSSTGTHFTSKHKSSGLNSNSSAQCSWQSAHGTSLGQAGHRGRHDIEAGG